MHGALAGEAHVEIADLDDRAGGRVHDKVGTRV
jgi:hypothetical protein